MRSPQFSKEDTDQRGAKVNSKSGVEPNVEAPPVKHSLVGGGFELRGAWAGSGQGLRGAGAGGLPASKPRPPAGPCAPAALTRQFASFGALEQSPRGPAKPGDVPSGICPGRRGRAPSGSVPKGAWGRRDNCRGSLGAREASGWLGSRGEGAGGRAQGGVEDPAQNYWKQVSVRIRHVWTAPEPSMIP